MNARSAFWKRLEESARSIKQRLDREALPETLVVLGSGFKGFERQLDGAVTLESADIDHFPVPAVEGHGSSLVVGSIGDEEVAVMTGRVHLYEGWTPGEVVYPIRVLSTLGVQRVLLTNAAGSVDPTIKPGSVVLVKDHINLTYQNCLIGPEAQELGPIFLDMSECYDPAWRAKLAKLGGTVEGVYGGCIGPTYETPAETKMLRGLGLNVVGMSTVQEAIAAHQLKMRVACMSFVTNMTGGLGDKLEHADVVKLVNENKPRLYDLLARAVTAV